MLTATGGVGVGGGDGGEERALRWQSAVASPKADSRGRSHLTSAIKRKIKTSGQN